MPCRVQPHKRFAREGGGAASRFLVEIAVYLGGTRFHPQRVSVCLIQSCRIVYRGVCIEVGGKRIVRGCELLQWLRLPERSGDSLSIPPNGETMLSPSSSAATNVRPYCQAPEQPHTEPAKYEEATGKSQRLLGEFQAGGLAT